MPAREISANLSGAGLTFGLVVSRFNDFLTRHLKDGAIDCLIRHGGREEDITVAWVPGSNEIPQAVKKMAEGDRFNAIIALGVVVQGATTHAELINSQVSRSLAAISLESGVPVINGVVAADNLEQAIERCGTKAGNKGWQAAEAAIEMANLFKALGSKR